MPDCSSDNGRYTVWLIPCPNASEPVSRAKCWHKHSGSRGDTAITHTALLIFLHSSEPTSGFGMTGGLNWTSMDVPERSWLQEDADCFVPYTFRSRGWETPTSPKSCQSLYVSSKRQKTNSSKFPLRIQEVKGSRMWTQEGTMSAVL